MWTPSEFRVLLMITRNYLKVFQCVVLKCCGNTYKISVGGKLIR